VNYTEELALKQAERADQEIAAGRYAGRCTASRGGAKDLIAYLVTRPPGERSPFKEQTLDLKRRWRAGSKSGAVLVRQVDAGRAGDGRSLVRRYDAQPVEPEAGIERFVGGLGLHGCRGLVGFAIGSETLGSIVSPCSQCGAPPAAHVRPR